MVTIIFQVIVHSISVLLAAWDRHSYDPHLHIVIPLPQYLDEGRNIAHVTSWLSVGIEVEFLGVFGSKKSYFILRSESRV